MCEVTATTQPQREEDRAGVRCDGTRGIYGNLWKNDQLFSCNFYRKRGAEHGGGNRMI